MINEKLQAEIEQGRAAVIEFYPPLLYQFNKGLIEQGFTKEEAFALVKTYLASMVIPK